MSVLKEVRSGGHKNSHSVGGGDTKDAQFKSDTLNCKGMTHMVWIQKSIPGREEEKDIFRYLQADCYIEEKTERDGYTCNWTQ